jgi:hypothetical protein
MTTQTVRQSSQVHSRENSALGRELINARPNDPRDCYRLISGSTFDGGLLP